MIVQERRPVCLSIRLALAIVVVSVTAMASVATALAATPIGLGPGEASPHLAVGNGGVGYLTWEVGSVGSEEVRYCRLDPGAVACSETKNLGTISGFEYADGSAPLVATGRVLVLSSRFGTGNAGGENFLYSSADGFASHQVVANPAPGFTDATFAPAGTVAPQERIATVKSTPVTGGGFFQASGTTGLEAASTSFDLTTGHSTIAEAVAVQGSAFYAAYVDEDTVPYEVFWRRYTGSGGGVAGLNKSTEWSAAAPIAQGGDNVALAGGPSGLYIAYDSPDGTVMLQQFNGVGWNAPVALTGAGVPNGWFALSEDSAGVLHLAWQDVDGALRYRYARDATNTSFTNPQTLATGGGFRDIELGVEPSGFGWVAWQDFNVNPFVNEALPVAPGEPPVPATNPSPSPTPQPSPPSPTEYKGPSKTTAKSLGKGLEGTLSTPKQCVSGGIYFKARVAVKRKGSHAHKVSYSIPKVKFFLAGKLVATDTKKPFEAQLATTGIPAGTSVAVAARISVLLRKGHRHSTVDKTLKATVKTCP